MIDYHKSLVAALNTILPTHYELNLHSGLQTPCISYQERNNSVEEQGDTIGYSRLSYTIKVWGNDLAAIQENAIKIDGVLRKLGWRRTNSQELHDTQSTMIQKIMTYEALANEKY
jgi:hypothetical protein